MGVGTGLEEERECVHWSELGHQGRGRKEDEKGRERENEKRTELFEGAVMTSCCCLKRGFRISCDSFGVVLRCV